MEPSPEAPEQVVCCGIRMDLNQWHQHVLLCHDYFDVLPCNACSTFVGTKCNLLRHLNEEHLFACNECQYKTFIPSHMIWHSESHSTITTPSEGPTSSQSSGPISDVETPSDGPTSSQSSGQISELEPPSAREEDLLEESLGPGPSRLGSFSKILDRGTVPPWYQEDVQDVKSYYKKSAAKVMKNPSPRGSNNFLRKIYQKYRNYNELPEEDAQETRHCQVVPDLSGSIQKLLQRTAGVHRVILATHLRVHQNDPWERGWGCGYRNLQTLVDSICCNEELSAASGLDRIPTFTEIQKIIEEAWAHDFDKDGAKSMQFTLLGTPKWIGASDIATFLQYRHLQAHLIDITMKPNQAEMQFVFVNFAYDYYTTTIEPLPIFFQEEGHSRSIIGVEETAYGRNLLVFDPLHNLNDIKAALYSQNADRLASYLRWVPQRLKRDFYQIVLVKGVIPNRRILKRNREFEFGFNNFELNVEHPCHTPYRWPERVR